VDTIVKVIICVVVGTLLLTGVYAVVKSGIESAKNRVNDSFDYNPDGEGGGGGDEISDIDISESRVYVSMPFNQE
jgi:hypothetical protein